VIGEPAENGEVLAAHTEHVKAPCRQALGVECGSREQPGRELPEAAWGRGRSAVSLHGGEA